MTDPRATIRTFILSEFMPGEPASNLTDDRALRSEGIVDSMGTMKLVQFLEETYGLSVEAHEVDDANLGSVDAIVAFVREKSAG
jgi:acyl carrier protein